MAIDTIKASAILDGAVDSADLADSAVTSAKIADTAITTAKIADTAITTAKVASDFSVSKNLVINGAMQIDQRNATTTALGYTLDRFYLFRSSNHDQHAFSVVQDTDSPDGFSNSLKYTTTTAETTVDSDELLYLRQRIEAQTLQQLAYGTSSAKSVTLSFWVKSSVTGTFAVSLYQDDASKQLSKTYTINSANTWEKKTITYIGNTADVINNDNGNGLQINWILDAGSDYTSTDSSSSWIAYGSGGGFAYGHATNAVATTLNATWYITGVQLEVGSSATEFEHRPYTTELQMCYRYLENIGLATAAALWSGYGATVNYVNWQFKVEKRALPTISGAVQGTAGGSYVTHALRYTTGGAYASFGYDGSSYAPVYADAEL